MAIADALQHEDRFYIVSGTAPPDVRTLVLKHGETFAVFNNAGNIDHLAHTAQGLFANGMRYLSRWDVRLQGERLMMLSARVTNDNSRIIVDMTNPDLRSGSRLILPRGTLHLSRSIFLYDHACFERMTLTNYSDHAMDVALTIDFECDFADIFEVRGMRREQHGIALPPSFDDKSITLGYAGLDGVLRHTVISASNQLESINERQMRFIIAARPAERSRVELAVRCLPMRNDEEIDHQHNARLLRSDAKQFSAESCRIDSSNITLNQWISRSHADIRMLMTQTDSGPYPYAGVPWFSAPFGRDGIITALQLLWVNPTLARGVLAFLAATQAREHDPSRDAQPGKILHEMRNSEMAATNEIPFGRYYGSVDATPLFVVLAGAYYRATADLEFLRSIWPNVLAAINWIDEFGDLNGDGLIDYQSTANEGLINQGWKDSHDSVFHDDGTLAGGPFTLCEVQGYVYDARLNAANMARALGEIDRAESLEASAKKIRDQFNDLFWDESLGMYVLALDGDKRPCRVRTSNAGHLLFSGIVDRERARKVRDHLLGKEMYSGWGVRTVGSKERRYNPMSYHNGSIWPHDNAMIAAGFARYGFRDAVMRMFEGWMDASHELELHRLPELFCGFRRRRGRGPTLYPVACSPQAWAAGAVFMMLGACLGISVEGERGQVHLRNPRLPPSVKEICIRNLRIGVGEDGVGSRGSIDFLVHRHRRDIGVLVLRKEGPVDLVVTK